jgi:nicotinate-nucleotide pyrophosphorylase (carboxylating)
MNYLIIDKIIKDALVEDGVFDDITTNSILNGNEKATCDIIFKEDGVLCGKDVFNRVFDIMEDVEVTFNFEEGQFIEKNTVVGTLKGLCCKILSGERVALNLLQRMSGIATITYKLNKILEGTNIKIADTRKTTPNLRYLEKYAVTIGGGINHRYNLSDMAMIKDNHIQAAGSIKAAVDLVRKKYPFVKKIEVECESIDEVKKAIEAKADIIMLDNMNYEAMKVATGLIGDKAIVEVSGNIDEEKVDKFRDLKINYLSSGSLTHSVKAIDISMKNLKRFD